jgi:hypothetical protein
MAAIKKMASSPCGTPYHSSVVGLSLSLKEDVSCWHKADITVTLSNVRFWG